MTLRDCTVFLRFSADGDWSGDEGEVEARLGDLDLKSPDKAGYWEETERGLVEGGWYEGIEKGEGGRSNGCRLGRVDG